MARQQCLEGEFSVEDIDLPDAKFVGHFNNIVDIGWRWWNEQHPGTHFTTGFAMIAVALFMCERVNVYGFSDEAAPSYHYYDHSLPGPVHNFEAEHALFDKMETNGVAIMCGYIDVFAELMPLRYFKGAVYAYLNWLKDLII